jgi:hypothetical protein
MNDHPSDTFECRVLKNTLEKFRLYLHGIYKRVKLRRWDMVS